MQSQYYSSSGRPNNAQQTRASVNDLYSPVYAGAKYEGQPPSKIRSAVTQNDHIPKKNGPPDVHELQKREIYSQRPDDFSTYRVSQISQIGLSSDVQDYIGGGIGDIGFEDFQMHLNSVHAKNISDLSVGELSFTSSEYTATTRDLTNCVAMHLDDFYFPSIIVPTGSPDYFYDRRVYLQITTLPFNESVIAFNQRAYHFMLNVENPNSLAVRLVPMTRDFYFKRPINAITEIRFRFMAGSEFDRINIPLSNLSLSAIPGSAPARFTLNFGDATQIFGLTGLLGTPVIIKVNGFISGNPTLDNAVNSKLGVYVTTVVSSSVIELGSLSFATVLLPIVATCVVEKNKIVMQIRFSCISQNVTNNIDLVHT